MFRHFYPFTVCPIYSIKFLFYLVHLQRKTFSKTYNKSLTYITIAIKNLFFRILCNQSFVIVISNIDDSFFINIIWFKVVLMFNDIFYTNISDLLLNQFTSFHYLQILFLPNILEKLRIIITK